PKIHDRDPKARRAKPGERRRGDPGRRVRPCGLWRRYECAEDHFGAGVICEKVETAFQRDLAERLVAGWIENALGHGPPETSNPRERSQKRDLVHSDGTNRAVSPLRGCSDRYLMDLGELVDRHDFIESADGRRHTDVAGRPRE